MLFQHETKKRFRSGPIKINKNPAKTKIENCSNLESHSPFFSQMLLLLPMLPKTIAHT